MRRRRWTNLLVEGGSAVLGSLVDARLIDEAHIFIAPRLIGGNQARTAVGGEGARLVSQAVMFTGCESSQLEGDIYWRGWM